VRHIPSPFELAVRKSRPAGYWRLEEDTPEKLINVIDDSRGKIEYVGSVEFGKGPSLGQGKNVGALKFDGSESSVVISGLDLPQGRYDDYTIALWIRPNVIKTQDILVTRVCLRKGSYYLQRLQINKEGQFEHSYYQTQSKNWGSKITSEVKANADQWYYVVVSAKHKGLKQIFIDGISSGKPIPRGMGSSFSILDSIDIGSAPEVGEGYSNNSYNGDIAEITFYDRALSPDEIRGLYMSVK